MQKVKPSDIKNYIQGNAKYYLGAKPHEREQAKLRAYLCSPCLVDGRCKVCKCSTPNMFYAPNKIDSEQKWGPFLSEIQWKALKENINEYKEFIDSLNDATE